MSTRLSPWPKAGKSHVQAFPSVLTACRSLHQNAGWEEEEPGAGITSSAWSGAHGSLVEVSRKAFPNGEMPSVGLFCFKYRVLAYSRRNFVFVHSIPRSYPDPHLHAIENHNREGSQTGTTNDKRLTFGHVCTRVQFFASRLLPILIGKPRAIIAREEENLVTFFVLNTNLRRSKRTGPPRRLALILYVH